MTAEQKRKLAAQLLGRKLEGEAVQKAESSVITV
jgi:hypothetical protein